MKKIQALVVGLTGGIGSGKTLATEYFAELGVRVVDSDEISRRLTREGGAAIAAIQVAFGDEYISAEGALDRDKMRQLVFSSVAERKRLESILHPMIRIESERLIRQAIEDGYTGYFLLVVPLLIETDAYRNSVSRVAVIDCGEETQVSRVKQRSNLGSDEIMLIIRTQVSRDIRLAVADDIIPNDGSCEELRQHVATLHAYYLSLLDAEAD